MKNFCIRLLLRLLPARRRLHEHRGMFQELHYRRLAGREYVFRVVDLAPEYPPVARGAGARL